MDKGVGSVSDAVVRRATAADLPELVEMALDMHRQTGFSVFSVNRDKVEWYLRDLLENAFVVVGPGRGFFSGDVSSSWFSEDLCGWHKILYFYPKYRGRRLGVRFLRLFEDWAVARGARFIVIAVSSGVDVGRTGKLFEHRGYTCLGGVYRKECI